MKKILISEVMNRNAVSIEPSANLLDCARKMVQKRVGSLLVVKDKKLVGFISNDDILWALVKKTKHDLSKIRVIDIATKKIATARPTDTLDEAIKKMKQLKFRRLPVIQNKELVGIVTIRDILNFNPDIYEEIKEIEGLKAEQERLNQMDPLERKFKHEGICEECGNFGVLYKVNGQLMCDSCRSMI